MEGRHALVVEGYLATHEDVEHDAKTPHVDLGACVCPGLQQLGGGKVQTAAEGLECAARSEEIAQAKVDDLDVASFADEDILNLEVPVDDAVPVAVIQSTSDLPTELPGLLLLELPVGYDVVEHLAAVDILEKHVPVVVRPDDVAQATYVRVIEQGDDGSLPGRPDLLGVVVALLVSAAMVGVISRAPWDDLTRDLLTECDVSSTQMSLCVKGRMLGPPGERGGRELACSLLSSFLASLTLPMLPAPMVFPRIHFPDWVGMVVRDLALVAEAEARGSAVEGWTGAGPALWATVLAMSAAGDLR